MRRVSDVKEKGLMSSGTIWKQILFFSIPLLLGNLFQQLYNTVDSMVVGNYIGANALAAVGSSNPIINLLVSFFMGLSTGAGVIISRYYGAKDKENLHRSIHTAIALTLVAGIILTILGLIFSPFILKWSGVPSTIMEDAVLYLRIYFGGVLAVTLYNMAAGILQAVGDSKNPLYFLMISSILNIGLDLLFVVEFKMGIAGVAWATLIAQVCSAILIMILLLKTKESYQLVIKDIKIDFELFKKMIRLGLPSGIQNGIISFSNLIVQVNINSFGSYAMAGTSAYIKIDGFIILPIMSFAMAITTFTGQNMGAQEYERVKQGIKTCLKMACVTILIGSLVVWLLGDNLIRIFSKDERVIYYGLTMMKVLLPGYLFLSISHVLSGVLRGAGITMVPMIIMVANWCILRILWIYMAMPFFHNIAVVFAGYPITWIASTICIYWYFKKGNWLHKYSL
ncbi:MAG: MATE family efflux transporter [Erysipelotrichaceae bacterium]